MEATRHAVAATKGSTGSSANANANRRRTFVRASSYSKSNSRRRHGSNSNSHNNNNNNSHSHSGTTTDSSHSRGHVPLLQGCHSTVDSLDYQPLESLLTTSISSASASAASSLSVSKSKSVTTPSEDDAFVEEWLLLGRNKSSTDDGSVSVTPSPTQPTRRTGTLPTSSSATTESSSATTSTGYSANGSTGSSRGRSRWSPLVSPPRVWESPQRQHHRWQQRQTRSLEPRRRSVRRRNHTTGAAAAAAAVHTPNATDSRPTLRSCDVQLNHDHAQLERDTGSTNNTNSHPISPFVTPASPPPQRPMVETPIPKDYVDSIVAAFGPTANLYQDVLRVPKEDSPHTITPAKLRVAYFRQGRHVLQQHVGSSSGSNNNNNTDDGAALDSTTITAKQQFQAVTHAYEILTKPDWKAWYDAHGLTMMSVTTTTTRPAQRPLVAHVPSTTITPAAARATTYGHSQQQQQQLPNTDTEEDEADASSVYSGTSVYSSVSILRRSNSWGPTRSRSRSNSRTRVCWSEQVEELVYQPDPLNSSGEAKEPSIDESDAANQTSSRPKKARKSRCVIDSPGLMEDLEQMDTNFRRDFLDDLEASMDGLEAKIGGFVKYALSNERGQTADINRGEEKKCDDNDDDDDDDDDEHDFNDEAADEMDADDNSSIARRLFSHLTAPAQTTDVSAFTAAPHGLLARHTKSAPLKEANNGQPRVVPKKKKHKRKVDRVPTEDEMNGIRGAEMIEEAFEDPMDSNNINTTQEWNVQNAVASMATYLGAGPATASTSLSKSGNAVVSTSAYHRRDKLLEYYDLQSTSSILASLADVSSCAEATTVVSEKVSEAETVLNFGVVNTLTLAEALNESSDATTKGFVRLDRHTQRTPDALHSLLDTSDITYISKTTAELMSSNMPDCFGAIAKQARETLREVASVDETDAVVRGTGTVNTPHAAAGSDDGTFLSSIGAYLNSLVEDMQVFGRSIGANFGEANRTVVETMSFSDSDVDGMLRVLESELNAPGGNINEVPTTFRNKSS